MGLSRLSASLSPVSPAAGGGALSEVRLAESAAGGPPVRTEHGGGDGVDGERAIPGDPSADGWPGGEAPSSLNWPVGEAPSSLVWPVGEASSLGWPVGEPSARGDRPAAAQVRQTAVYGSAAATVALGGASSSLMVPV